MTARRAQFLLDLSVYVECRPNPNPESPAVLPRPGARVLAPVYRQGFHAGYAPGTVVSRDEIDRMATVEYDEQQDGEPGFPATGVIAYAISLLAACHPDPSPVDSMPRR
ncbi:hypothetical protein G3I59_05280 [Amycolatopsis rubida]|uniref:Uncharacterized protein n=1 Tax=Amycolatopsis rubida TaxID=112413 RepID=A0A1I5VCJ8_9PSEU|nr:MULTISPECIES: hypothetical protein [Amycolatopsis]MYW90046.1 hypothetical protein [Amycolatopsis rubida]NEC55023.1 hypothetical protein [Amycolatopsis rubida]OAP21122.1 hypothetical protein A4R44_08098 [Amycolatopsis sp. M39]SFQ05131.1 hypothetical protein SAMN05421854_108295 [Amycolatopsis rubida]